MMLRRIFLAGCASLLLGGAAANAEDKPADKVIFTSSSVSMLNLPVYTADVLGYFSAQKIAQEIMVLKNGGATALAAVLGGNAQVYIGAPSSALGAANKGADAVAFGAIMTEVALNMVVHRDVAEKLGLSAESSTAERFKALKGLKIGVTGAGSATHQVAQYALKQAGLDPERDATIVFVNSNEDMQAAYRSKRVDALVTANPVSDLLVQGGSFLLIDGAAGTYPTLKGMAHIVLVAKRSWLTSDGDRVTRLLAAVRDAEVAIHDDKLSAKARDLVHDKYFADLDRKVFDQAWQSVRPAIARTPEIARDAMQRNIAFLREFSEQQYTIAPETVYTNAYQPK